MKIGDYVRVIDDRRRLRRDGLPSWTCESPQIIYHIVRNFEPTLYGDHERIAPDDTITRVYLASIEGQCWTRAEHIYRSEPYKLCPEGEDHQLNRERHRSVVAGVTYALDACTRCDFLAMHNIRALLS